MRYRNPRLKTLLINLCFKCVAMICMYWLQESLWGEGYLTGDNFKVVWPEFSTLSLAF
jgi:hypothetical protein